MCFHSVDLDKGGALISLVQIDCFNAFARGASIGRGSDNANPVQPTSMYFEIEIERCDDAMMAPRRFAGSHPLPAKTEAMFTRK